MERVDISLRAISYAYKVDFIIIKINAQKLESIETIIYNGTHLKVDGDDDKLTKANEIIKEGRTLLLQSKRGNDQIILTVADKKKK